MIVVVKLTSSERINPKMGGIIWSELFPSKLTVCIFIGYMSLFISQGKFLEFLIGAMIRMSINSLIQFDCHENLEFSAIENVNLYFIF